MSKQFPIGPSATADWERKEVEVDEGHLITVLLLQDAANIQLAASGRDSIFYYLPESALLLRDANRLPVISLQLVLSHKPGPEEYAFHPLVKQGVLTFTVTLQLPSAALSKLEQEAGRTYLPLSVIEVSFSLVSEDGTLIGPPSTGNGPNAQATLSLQLSRNLALAVLRALDRQISKLELRSEIRLSTAPSKITIDLMGDWLNIYNHLSNELDPEESILMVQLRDHFEILLERKIINGFISSDDGSVSEQTDRGRDLLFKRFLRLAINFILQRVTPELDPEDTNNGYLLRPKPIKTFPPLKFRETVSTTEPRITRLTAPLEHVIGGALIGQPTNSFVHMISP